MPLNVTVQGKVDRFRAYGTNKDIVVAKTVSGKTIAFESKDDKISHVVLYRGPPHSEQVVGLVDVNAKGKIKIDIVEPSAKS